MECEHGMGDPAWCTLCNGRERREAKQEALRKEMAGRFIPRRRPPARADGTWSSGRVIQDRLLVRGGLIDEFGAGKATLLR